MAFNPDLASYESTWQNDADARERSYNRREARDMQEVEFFADARMLEAHALAYDLSLPVSCDGSGVVEETYIGVDQTRVIPCKGCPACEMAMTQLLQADDRQEPEWMCEPEMVEFGVSRKSAGREVEQRPRRITVERWNGRKWTEKVLVWNGEMYAEVA